MSLLIGGKFAGGGYAVGPGGGVVTVGGGGVPSVTVDSNGNVSASGLDYSPGATDAREKGGAAAALNLAQHGYNPDDPASNGKLVAAIAGAACLVPVAGPVLGAAVEALYQVGQVLVGPMCSIGLLICKFGCTHTGPDWTPASWASTPPAAQQGGTPQAALWPVVTQVYASYMNCKPTISMHDLYAGFQGIWNRCFDGSATMTFAVHDPASVGQSVPLGYDPAWGQTDPNSDPNSYFNSYRITAQQNGVRANYAWLTVNAGAITPYGQEALSGGGRFGGRVVGGAGPARFTGGKIVNVRTMSPAAKAALAGGAALAAVALFKPALLPKGLRRWLRV